MVLSIHKTDQLFGASDTLAESDVLEIEHDSGRTQ